MDKSILVIYHSPCLDGFTAAWGAWRLFKDSADYIPGVYGAELPDVKDKVVYLLDFSYPRAVVEKMAKEAFRVIVLDHHASAQKDLQGLLDKKIIEGEFDMTRSGALMSWEYFHPTELVPNFVRYVSDRDLWKFNLSCSKEVNAALFSRPYSFEEWDKISYTSISDLIQEGHTLIRQFNKDVSEIKANAHRLTIAGYNVPAVNANHMFGSELCMQLCQGEPFSAYYWINKDGEYVFGLRSMPDTADVSKIAGMFGGGGHKCASGFRIKSLDALNINPKTGKKYGTKRLQKNSA